MKIALTGGTGFIGRYLIRQLLEDNNELVAWKRESSNLAGLDSSDIDWRRGELTDPDSMKTLVQGCDAVVHSALWKPGPTFRGGEGDLVRFAEVNVTGTLRLMMSAIEAGVSRFVFLSTCAVHDVILDDRPLDETHPCWSKSHYGAHKAAIEKFVQSLGLGQGYNVCALRPTGVYGLNVPAASTKWYDLVKQVARGNSVSVSGGGKEVHAADVATAVSLLLNAEKVAGEVFNCYDQYISQHTVAEIARELSGSNAIIDGEPRSPQHQIETGKLRARGMKFGGDPLLRSTIRQMIEA